ncbi:hypothetical protein BN1263440041 [Stenotrophomonas indicatrix]|nr:hypothetical protein BN1263440041 [Stenotrophomonas indicatrix]
MPCKAILQSQCCNCLLVGAAFGSLDWCPDFGLALGVDFRLASPSSSYLRNVKQPYKYLTRAQKRNAPRGTQWKTRNTKRDKPSCRRG